MIINFSAEDAFPLSHALKLLPKTRRGRSPHVSTIFRWAQRGLKGVRLETISIGGVRCTTREALQRFFARLTENGNHCGDGEARPQAAPARRHADQVAAEPAQLGL